MEPSNIENDFLDIPIQAELILGENLDDKPAYSITDPIQEEKYLKYVQERKKERPQKALSAIVTQKIITLEEMKKLDPSYIEKKIPQRCSENEIEQLLDTMPDLGSLDSYATSVATEQLKDLYRRRMSESSFLLEHSEDSFNAYRERQDVLLESAKVKHGFMYGMFDAFSESCVMTQATMKTKKKTGASMSTRLKGTIQNLKSLLYVQDMPADRTMNIHFRMKVTKRQVIDLSSLFVGTTMASLIINKDISIARVGVEYEDKDDILGRNISHDIYTAGGTRNYKSTSYFLRIPLKRDELYAHQLTPYKISQILSSQSEIGSNYRIIPSSFMDSFIDVYVNSNGTLNEHEKTNLHYYALEKIRSFNLKGFPDIKMIIPKVVEYSTLFKQLKKLPQRYETKNTKEYESVFFLEYDLIVCALHNYPSEVFVEESFKKAGIVVVEKYYKTYTKRLYAYAVILPRETDLKTLLGDLESLHREYVYAITEGSDMEKILPYPWVDTSRVTVNSIPQMWRYFGIEAARSYFIYDYTANKAAVNASSQARYTFLIADDMTFYGKPLGTTWIENKKRKDNDFVSMATYSHPMQNYTEAASKKSEAPVSNTSVSIAVSGSIYAGDFFPGVIKPSKKILDAISKSSNPVPLITEGSIKKSISDINEKMFFDRANTYINAPVKAPVINPHLIKLPKKKPLTVGAFPEGKKSRITFKISEKTKNLLEDYEIIARNIDPRATTIGSLNIISESDCVRMLSREYSLMEFPKELENLFDVEEKEVYTPTYNDFLQKPSEKDMEPVFLSFYNPRERFIPSSGTDVNIII